MSVVGVDDGGATDSDNAMNLMEVLDLTHCPKRPQKLYSSAGTGSRQLISLICNRIFVCALFNCLYSNMYNFAINDICEGNERYNPCHQCC